MNIKALALAATILGVYAAEAAAQDAPGSKVTPRTVAASGAFTLRDARPAAESRGKMLSAWLWNCNYAVTRLPDSVVTADRMTALERLLSEEIGAPLDGRTAVVEGYYVYVNGNASAAAANWNVAVGGAVGGAMAANSAVQRHAKCAREKSEGGWFDSSELTNNNSPLVAEIALRLDGKLFNARAAVSPEVELVRQGFWNPKAQQSVEGQRALDNVTAKANIALVQEVKRHFAQGNGSEAISGQPPALPPIP